MYVRVPRQMRMHVHVYVHSVFTARIHLSFFSSFFCLPARPPIGPSVRPPACLPACSHDPSLHAGIFFAQYVSSVHTCVVNA